jgi:hypothetical protein
MKRLTINNFGRLGGQRILVGGEWWLISSAIGVKDYLGVLQFVGRTDMIFIYNEIHTSLGVDSYVRMTYIEDGTKRWEFQLLLSELCDMNTTLVAIAHRLTEMGNV